MTLKAQMGLMLAVLTLGCSSARTQSRTPLRPLSSAELTMGYKDAVDMGTQYVETRGWVGAQLEGAHRPWPNVWCVRFGLMPKGSGKVLDLYFDGTRRVLIREVVTDDLEIRAQ